MTSLSEVLNKGNDKVTSDLNLPFSFKLSMANSQLKKICV